MKSGQDLTELADTIAIPDSNLTDSMRKMLSYKLNPNNSLKTAPQQAEDIGISERTYYRILADQRFIDACRHYRQHYIPDTKLMPLIAKLFELAQAGDLKAVELALKYCGELQTGSTQQVNVVQNTQELSQQRKDRVANGLRSFGIKVKDVDK